MKRIEWIESIYNMMDAGVFMQTFQNALKKKIEMNPLSFIKRLILGEGYQSVTPPQLTRELSIPNKNVLVIDLRDKRDFIKGHIDGAVWHPFDDFLGDIVMNNGYADCRQKPIVLVCDTGLKSKVAASVLADEGFSGVLSLKRGMRRWNRWEALLHFCKNSQDKSFFICRYVFK